MDFSRRPRLGKDTSPSVIRRSPTGGSQIFLGNFPILDCGQLLLLSALLGLKAEQRRKDVNPTEVFRKQ
ncbi:hypothetical protein BMIN_1641 [Bifidobacterium minimum]|uniref:Uncharacterized protein n=1 Tax=Bifidobacterium minimum TaxID=1693 RepID=A0A087BJF4_9BIFI|nr:hypothetical protein BMIN_1641 [Bifidobacterium minimum]